MRLMICLLIASVVGAGASASDISIKPKLEIEQRSAVGLESRRADQALWIVKPQAQARFSRSWSADVSVRVETAVADTGLGSRQTYARISRPLKISSEARLEIDEAVLTWRRKGARLRLGKQTVAWGVLDGLQVTDRFDAVRRRESVYIENRPDRISRWGARGEFSTGGVRWDAAVMLDGTGDQLAARGDTFEVAAPRFRGGLPAGTPLPQLLFDVPKEATIGLRATHTFGSNDASLLVINGPDTEPVIAPAGLGAVTLNYRSRTLIGASWQRSSGSRVYRTEIAWIPEHPVNTSAPLLGFDRRNRLLAGAGLDWSLPASVFLNAQLGVDWVEGDRLIRPNTDVISTLRVQKSWANDEWKAGLETIASLSDGDGTVRPSITWQLNDRLRLQTGVDVVWGSDDGLFGQHADRDRAWTRARLNF
ncbi:MAG: hypothetical protein AAGC77_03790 [Pseudomonadota bacterium]